MNNKINNLNNKENIEIEIKKKSTDNKINNKNKDVKCSEQQKKIRENCNPKNKKESGIHGLFGAKGNENLDKGWKDNYKNKFWYNFCSDVR